MQRLDRIVYFKLFFNADLDEESQGHSSCSDSLSFVLIMLKRLLRITNIEGGGNERMVCSQPAGPGKGAVQ